MKRALESIIDTKEEAMMAKLSHSIVKGIQDNTLAVRNECIRIVSSEVNKVTTKNKAYIDTRLNNAQAVIAVPGVIAGDNGDPKTCEFIDFAAYVKGMNLRHKNVTESFSKHKDKISDINYALKI
jgi:hypothetical protein